MSWLTHSWWKLLDGPPAAIALAACAIVCGAVIGSERERRDKPAGLRTLIFVCLGAAVFTMAGYVFTSSTGDSGRVAAQIVTGIGFLGAGVILHERRTVSGATTAATIWITASIGMTVAAGFAPAGVALSLVVRWTLGLGRAYEQRFVEHLRLLRVEVVFDPDHGKTRAHLLRILAEFNIADSVCTWSLANEKRQAMSVSLRLGHRNARDLIDQIACLPAVASLDEKPES